VRYFHAKKADINALDYTGNSALMWAVANSHEETVAVLLSLGADPTTKRPDGLDAFALAQRSGNGKIQQAVASAIEIVEPKSKGRVPASQEK
jgi:ankyrin repeat protein